MTLQFPRYSEDGNELTESQCDLSIIASTALVLHFTKDCAKYSTDEWRKLDNLLASSNYIDILRERGSAYKEWVSSIEAVTGERCNGSFVHKLAEDYVEKLFPLLEPPHSSM